MFKVTQINHNSSGDVVFLESDSGAGKIEFYCTGHTSLTLGSSYDCFVGATAGAISVDAQNAGSAPIPSPASGGSPDGSSFAPT